MQAYDVKRKRIVNVELMEDGAIVAYSIPGKPGEWFFPLIVDGWLMSIIAANAYNKMK